MDAVQKSAPATSGAAATRAAWQVVGVREDTVTPYFANALNTHRLSVSTVRSDVWAWFPAVEDGGFFPVPLTVSKIGVPTRDPHSYAQSFRRMAQKYRRTYTYVEVKVHDTGTNEHLFLYWFDPSLEVCWVQYGLHQTVRSMILYCRSSGAGTPEGKDLWRFRARLSKTGAKHAQHEFTSASWRFGEVTDALDMAAARQLQAGDVLVERYPFCLQDDPLIGEPVWSNGYAWLPVKYGTDVAWECPNRQAVAFLQKIGAARWPALVACVQDQYLEDLVRLKHLAPDLKEALQGLHHAQYFDGKESIDQFLRWMDPELLDTSEHGRLFQLYVPLRHDSSVRLFIKETLDAQQGHVVGIYRTREDAAAGQRPYVTFPTVGNWLRRIEYEIKIGLHGAWRRDEHGQPGSDISLAVPVKTSEPTWTGGPWPSRHVVFERVSHMIPSCQIRWVSPKLINGFIVNFLVRSPQAKKGNSRLLGQRLHVAFSPGECANALPDASAKHVYLRRVKETNEGAYIRYEWPRGFAEYVLFVKPVPLPNGGHLLGMSAHDRQEARPLFQFPTIGSKRPNIKTKQPPYTLTLEKLRSFAPGEATRFVKPLARTHDARFPALPGEDWNVLTNFEGMIIAAVRPYAHEWRKSIYQFGTIALIGHPPRHWPTVIALLEGKTVLSLKSSVEIDDIIQQESVTPRPKVGTQRYRSCYSGPCSFVFAEDEGFIFCFVDDDETLVVPVPDRYLSLVDWIGAGHAVLTPTQVQAREMLRRRKLSKEEKVGLPDVDILGTVSHSGSQQALFQQFEQAIAEHFEGCVTSEVISS